MSAGTSSPVPSPCIGVCRMDEISGLCIGCLRTLDEIALWSVLDDDDKRAVREALPPRRRLLPPAPTADKATPA